MAFHKITVQLTDRQMRVLMNEASATGLRVTTICRMLLHDDIASGRADRHARMQSAERRAEIARQRVAAGISVVDDL